MQIRYKISFHPLFHLSLQSPTLSTCYVKGGLFLPVWVVQRWSVLYILTGLIHGFHVSKTRPLDKNNLKTTDPAWANIFQYLASYFRANNALQPIEIKYLAGCEELLLLIMWRLNFNQFSTTNGTLHRLIQWFQYSR